MGPASLRARPLRNPPWRGGPAAPERSAHAQSEPSPGPAAISGEKPPGPRLGRDMEAVKAFNSEVRAPSRAFPRGRGAGGALGPGAFPAPSRCARLAAGRGRNWGAAAGQSRPAGARSGLPREGHRGAAGAAVSRAGGGAVAREAPRARAASTEGLRETTRGGRWGRLGAAGLFRAPGWRRERCPANFTLRARGERGISWLGLPRSPSRSPFPAPLPTFLV